MRGLTLTLLLISTPALAAPMGQIALPGSYHGDEMPMSPSRAWLGLYESGAGLEWRLASPSFHAAVDPTLDGPGEQTGVEVVIPGQEPLLLVRDVPALRPGVVTRLPVARQAMQPGARLPLADGLALVAALDDAGAYTLSLVSADGRSQALCEHQTLHDDTVPTLLLAGDLDADGRMDLLIDTSNHYNLSRVTLYLSSAAGAGDWVAPVAALQTTGC